LHFSSTLHFQFHSALFQLHNTPSCSFLALLFIPLQTILLVLFVPFPILVIGHSCAELLFVPLSMLLQFTPLQHYFLSLFDNIVAHYNLVYSFPSRCCGSFYLCCFAPFPTLLFPLVHIILPLFFPCVGFKSRCNFEVEVLGSTSFNYKCLTNVKFFSLFF
jgi:hypothetical protein